MATADFLPARDNDIQDIVFDTADEQPQTEFDRKLEDFSQAMVDLGNNGEILVKRQTAGGKDPMEHVGYFEPDEYSYGQLVEHLRDNYGGGKYRIYLRANGKNRGNSLVHIASKTTAQNGESGHNAHGEMSNVVSTVMGAIREQNERMNNMLQQTKADPMADMERMFGMMTMMRTAMGLDTQQTNGGLAQLKESLEVMESLGVTVNQKGEDESAGFVGVLEKLAPAITAAASAPQQQQQQPRPNPQPRQGEPMFNNVLIKSGLAFLLKAAKDNADPASYAEMIFTQLGEARVREFITAPDAAEKLLKLDKRVAEYSVWFDDLAEHVKAHLGLESKFGHLYESDESVINAENDTTGGSTECNTKESDSTL